MAQFLVHDPLTNNWRGPVEEALLRLLVTQGSIQPDRLIWSGQPNVAPVYAGSLTRRVVADPPVAKPKPQGMPDWLKLLLLGGAVVGGVALLAKLLEDDDEDPPSPADRLAANREQGARFERMVEKALISTFPEADVLSQVPVTTPDGKQRRADFALKNANGSVTPVEVKNVSVLTERHVRQAEDHREGLRHSYDVRSGRPIVVVREDTVVQEEHARRVRVIRMNDD